MLPIWFELFQNPRLSLRPERLISFGMRIAESTLLSVSRPEEQALPLLTAKPS